MSLDDFYAELNQEAAEDENRKRATAMLNLHTGYGANPADEAEKVRISRETGVPVEVMDDPEVRNDAGRQAFMKTVDVKDNPGTIDFLTYQQNAKVAMRQIREISGVERALRNLAVGATRDVLGSGIKGMGAIINARGRIAENIPGSQLPFEFGLPRLAHEIGLGDVLTNAGENIKQYYGQFAPKGEQAFGDQVASGVGQMAPQLAMFSNPFTAPLGVAMMAGQGTDQMAEKIAMDKESQKASQYRQDMELLSGGLITAVTEWATSKFQLKGLQALVLKNRLLDKTVKIVLGGVEEGAQEFSENLGQDLVHIAATNPDSQLALGQAIEAGEVGGIVGTIAQSVIQGALHIRTRGTQRRYQELSDASKAQKLRDMEPATYQDFTDRVTANLAGSAEGAVTDIYVDGNTFHQVMLERGFDPDEVAMAVPSIGQQMAEARATGGDIVIPLNEFAGKIAGTEIGDALEPHIRSTADAYSVAELDAATKFAPAFDEQMRSISEKTQAYRDWMASQKEVRDTVYNQLVETGTYTKAASRSFSALVGNFYATQAREMGMTPAELYARLPYKVLAGEIAQGQMTQGELAALNESVKLWDYANRISRSDAWFEGANTNEESINGFSEALSEGGDQLQAHGMAKEATLSGAIANLTNILQNGLDPARRGGVLDTAPLVSKAGEGLVGATATGSAYSEGPFQLVAKQGVAGIKSANDIAAILVNQENADLVPALRNYFQSIAPDIIVDSYSNAGKVTKQIMSGQVANQSFAGMSEQAAKIKVLAGEISRGQMTQDEHGITYDQTGKINLNENFQKWFGESKVVDETGAPMVVYHGTPGEEFTTFDKKRGGTGPITGHPIAKYGFWFSPKESYTDTYAGKEGAKIPVYLSLNNPYRMQMYGKEAAAFADNRGIAVDEKVKPFIDKIKAKGYDGIEIIGTDGQTKEFMVFEPTQIKSVNNRGTWNPNDPNILNQDMVNKIAQALTENGPDIDSPVAIAPNPYLYQINPGSQAEWKQRTTAWMEKNGYTSREISKHLKAIDGQMKIFSALGDVQIEMFPKGEKKNPGKGKGPFRQNSDPIYKISFDASAMCVRRLEAGATAAAIEAKIGRSLTSSERMALVVLFQQAGKTAPCLYCYVESPRAKMSEFAQKAADIVTGQKAIPKSWSKTMRDIARAAVTEAKGLSFAEGELNVNLVIDPLYQKDHIEEAEALAAKAPATWEFINKNALAAKANLPKLYEEYSGQIMELPQELIDELNNYAGLRFFSSSDFQAEHVVDLMQAFIDMEVRRIRSHSHTKVVAFAEIFGKTGQKINASLFAKTNERGEIVADTAQGMDWNEARRLRKENPDVGTIMVATSDEQLQWALSQDWIDYVIPFHASGMQKKMFGELGWQDYSSTQSEKAIDKGVKPEKIRMHDIGTQKGITDEKGTRAYLKLAMERRLYPVFPAAMFTDYAPIAKTGDEKADVAARRKQTKAAKARWKAMVEKGKIDWNQINPNYFKMKKDYARTDTPFNPVKAKFNTDKISQVIDSFLAGNEPKSVADQAIVDLFMQLQKKHGEMVGIESMKAKAANQMFMQAAWHGSPHTFKKFSTALESRFKNVVQRGEVFLASNAGNADARYLELAKDPVKNQAELQKMVDEAAKAAGYNVEGYHGTNSKEPFNVFRVLPANDIYKRPRAVFIADSKKTAEYYADGGRIISVYLKADKLFDVDDAKTITSLGESDYYKQNKDELDGWANLGESFLESVEAGDYEAIEKSGLIENYIIPNGYDGFTTYEQEGKNYAVFNPTQIKSADPVTYDKDGNVIPLSERFNPNKESILYQGQGGEKRGGFNPETLTTVLTQSSDYSTFLHESAHFFLTAYSQMAAMPEATQQIQEDMQTVLDWFGVKDLNEWNALTLEQQRKHHEAFAYNFEIYLFGGKAPSIKMQGVFERFAAWLKKVYQSIRDELNAVYRQEHGTDLPVLTGEVKQVMDRMLASDQQIEQAEYAASMGAIFQTQAESGMDDATWAAYLDMQEEAHQDAVREHRKASMRQMKWLSGAKSKYVRLLQSEANFQRGKITEQVIKEVNEMPIYVAKDALKNATPTEQMAIADGMGYKSIEELKLAIANAPKKSAVVKEEVDRRMLEENGELVDPRIVEQKVNEAIHNEARQRFITVELRHLAKATQPVRIMQAAARMAAQKMLGRKTIFELRPRDYVAAEARAGKAAQEALKAGDFAGAVKAKENQLLQNALAVEAMKARGEVETALKNWKKLFRPDDKVAKTHDMNYVGVARAILAKYTYGKDPIGASDKPASYYVDNIRKYDADFYAEIEGLLGGLDKEVKDIKQTSLNEFRDLVEQVGALWHLSRRNKQSEVDGQLVDRTEIVRELNEHLRSMNLKEFRPGLDKAVTGWEKKQMMFMGVRAAFRRVEAWVDAMDGNRPGKPFRKYIWNPISDAVTKYRLEKTKYLKEYVDLIGEYKHLFNQKPVASDADGINYTFNTDPKNGSELIHALLHTGNDSNKRKLLVGRGWATIDEATGIMDTRRWDKFIADSIDKGAITKDHYDFCQKVWDLMERMKPAAQKAHHDMYGYYFDEITADPIATKWGIYNGGYVPAVTDPDLVTEAEMHGEQELTMGDNSFMFPTTGRGFTMKRVEYNKQLLLNISSLAGHIDKVLKFAYIEPRVKDVARIIKTNRAFGEAMDAIDPTIRGDMLVPWLQRTAMQMVSMPSTGKAGRAADKAFTWLRTNTGMQMMVGNVTNTLQQFTGIPIVITKVKAHYVRNALWQFVRAPKEATEFVSVKSDYMKTRVDNYAFEMQATMDAYLNDVNKFEKLQDFAQKHGYFLQQGTQGIVDTIAWISAYNQAAEQNMDEADAIREADSVVRETQGSFAPEDISRIETLNAFVRMFTHFYSYFNMLANLNATEFTKTVREMGVKRGMGRLLHTYAFGFMIPAVMAEIIVQAAGGFDTGDDDEWDFWDAFCLFFGAQGRALAGMVPGVGPAIMAGFNAFNSKPYDDRISTSPAVSAMEGVVRTPFTVCKAIADDGSWKRAGKDMLTTLGIISGLPLGQLGKPVGYLADVAQGKAKPERPMDVVRGVISGKDVNRKQ